MSGAETLDGRTRAVRAVRIALLTEIPAPFRIQLFNALAAEPGIEFHALFLSRNDPRRNYPVYEEEFRFAWSVLRGFDTRLGGRWTILNRGSLGALRRLRPDVIVVGGWNQPAFWQALGYARLSRVPLVVWVESTARDARSGAASFELAKRAMLSAASGCLVPGSTAADYVRALGVPAGRITLAPNAVDLEVFSARVAEARKDRERLRAELGLRACTFLYVGRLAAEKAVDVLLRSFARAPGELVVIGTGPEEARYRAQAGDRVRFLGYLERDRLVPWYAAADAFVLPSRSEPWGMVLNEAAAAGLPLVASEAAGGAHDLIEHGVNGFRVPVDDEAALTAALERLAGNPEFRASAGARSLELARRFTPEAWALAVAAHARRLAGQRLQP